MWNFQKYVMFFFLRLKKRKENATCVYLYISIFQRNGNLRICSLSHQKLNRLFDERMRFLGSYDLLWKGQLWCLEKKSDENNLKRDGF